MKTPFSIFRNFPAMALLYIWEANTCRALVVYPLEANPQLMTFRVPFFVVRTCFFFSGDTWPYPCGEGFVCDLSCLEIYILEIPFESRLRHPSWGFCNHMYYGPCISGTRSTSPSPSSWAHHYFEVQKVTPSLSSPSLLTQLRFIDSEGESLIDLLIGARHL